MQTQIWAKTLLSSYRFLDRFAGAIDKIIEKKALSGSSLYHMADDTLNLAQQIIDLSERKVKLINIKVLIEKSLKAMPSLEARLLIKRDIEKEPVENVLQEFQFAKRTFFRKITAAETMFMSKCVEQGFSVNRLEEYLKGENIIQEIKKSVEKEDYKSSSLSS